ncbi:hypothetical protein [Fluviicola chungangensis]|uniref:Uncharacterized protein n=1 Tax=Fluviicola chungangensis TaxID=2597671 RepID=A0A556N330_9FLAO|nr:hypothetical protein [Fluviicola chungangensis]TSJ46561.1 hypothetical protein FO442_05220 [Fluviicola chungangensis]
MNKNKFSTGQGSLTWLLLAIFLWSTFQPAMVYAGGPTQPEVNSFTPVGVSDMVDPFTGDFSYNIPLMDVEGYPINIAYNSGVTMDQEASWVGLGWNLNVGAVTRNLRGVPDDFNGDQVKTEYSVKPMINMGLDAGLTVEIAGFKIPKVNAKDSKGGLKVGVGLTYNNYNGFGTSISVGPSFDLGKFMGARATAGFSLSGSDENGASVAPSASLSYKSSNIDRDVSRSATIGTAFNSRAGLQSLSYGFSATKQNYSVTRKKNLEGKTVVTGQYKDDEGSYGSKGGGSFDLGLNQYMPRSRHPMWGAGVSFNVNLAGSFFFTDAQGNIGVRFSKNWIPDESKTLNTRSYGYLYQENGQNNESAQLDFNRDNDIPFSQYTPFLASTYQTYDIFSVSAQGTGGSFRPMRNDVGFVHDPSTFSLDISGNGGLELGFGNLTDIGIDIQIPVTTTRSGTWEDGNQAISQLKYAYNSPNKIANNFYFIEANEKAVVQDELMTTQFSGDAAERIELGGSAISPKLRGSLVQSSGANGIQRNVKSKRELTNNQFYFLTRKEVEDDMGLLPINSSIYNPSSKSHIAEVTQLGTDGRRYVFALPAYSKLQKEATFAVGTGMYGSGGLTYANDYSGIIDCGSNFSTLASMSNKEGIDNYYSATETPAYAHSFMLSAVLSDDYIDSDGDKGPTPNDLGSYVSFEYSEPKTNKWRSPIQANTAFYNEGLRSDPTDDKASYSYGEKDLYYIKKITTKNFVAVFETEPRKDGRGAAGPAGGLAADDANAMMALKSITLYVRKEFEDHPSTAVPVQKVEFDYSYELCPNYPGNHETSGPKGKLTLTKIKFSYQNSKKMNYRSYRFKYGENERNPPYAIKGSDRWGTYKPSPIGSDEATSGALSNGDFPYAEQDAAAADLNAAAWGLTKIYLPSGGEIEVDYESDDYAYVQHLKAAKMFKIVGVVRGSTAFPGTANEAFEMQSISSSADENAGLIFKLENPTDDVYKYAKPGDQLYYRALVELNPDGSNVKEKTEYISGYGKVESITPFPIGNTYYGYAQIRFSAEKLKTTDLVASYNTITKQAILFGRTQLSRTISNKPGFMPPNDAPAGEQAITDLANSMINAISSFKELVTGPNKAIYDLDKGTNIITNKSWVRMNCPSGRKFGGGSRVSEIRIKDNWDNMGGAYGSMYGQHFEYTLADGVTSSGVASYEPQLGGDENPWHRVIQDYVSQKRRLAMDDKTYYEAPLMESQFPSPSIGYSRVTISDLPHAGVTRTATGKVVKEFYTAKDFPTIVNSTHIDVLPKNSIFPIIPKYQYLTANQGFSIELNDMHGKPSKESVYAQGQSEPLSTVEYIYQKKSLGLDGKENFQLSNEVKVINPDGTLSNKTLGVRYDAVADFNESKTVSNVGKININTNSLVLSLFFAVIPPVYPGYDRTTNRFRSATFNKTIQKFGILEKTIANQDGSIVETNNLAYDSKTGEVLVTQTTTNFNDKVYSLNYPAYWKYSSFGQASTNILYSYSAGSISSNGFVTIPMSLNHFTEGDEVYVKFGSSAERGWVLSKTDAGIKLIDEAGDPITGGAATIKVVRSGYRNKQSTSMASMTSLDNPLAGIGSNQFSNVLNAGAVEFGENWRTYCNCFAEGSAASSNPYILGRKGNWRPQRSYTHLTGRTQSNYDGNTNIRKDGVFTSYAPFYKLNQGKWDKNQLNWTFVSEVTEFSPNGQILETRDALGRSSSTLFGFNGNLTTAVAANSRGQQIATGSFEDYNYTNCMEEGYFSKVKVGGTMQNIGSGSISTDYSHTGKNSIKVTQSTPVTFENSIPECFAATGCFLTLETPSNNKFTISQLLTNPPYQVEFELLGGTGDAYLSGPNEVTFALSKTSLSNAMIITVTDSKGCKAAMKITVVPGVGRENQYAYENIQFQY